MDLRERMRFRILGAIAAEEDGRPVPLGRPRQQAILGFLLLNRNTLVSTDSLVTALWEDDGPSTARNQIQTDLSILRRLIRSAGCPDTIRSRPTGYTIELASGQLDLDDFTAGIRAARAAADPPESVTLLRAALGLWTGTSLAGIKAPYAGAHRVHLEEQRLQAYERLFDLELNLGRHADVTAELFGLVKEHSLRERLVAQLMVALYRGGRQADGLTVARALRTALAEEHGLDPGRDFQQLEQAILRGDPGLDLTPDGGAGTGGLGGRRIGPAPRIRILPGAGLSAAPSRPAPRMGPVPMQLPRDLHGIVGRPDHVARLGEILATPGRHGGFAIAVLTGMAGAGKTTLAIHFSHQIADQFPDGQLYVNLRGFDANPVTLSPADVLRGFLVALGDQPQRLPDDPDALASLYRTRMAGRQMLMLLDNARDAAQIRPLLPGSSRCAVLVTSRNQLPGLVATDGAQLVTVNMLTSDQARALMIGRLGAQRVGREHAAATDIAAHCGRLPLALALVTANAAAQPEVPLASIARELRGARAGLGPFRIDGEVHDMAAVFSWSYDTLSAGAATLFRGLGAHPVPEVSLDAAASLAGVPRAAAGALLAELARANLITEYADQRFTAHDLLRAFAVEQTRVTGAADESRPAMRRLVDHYLHSALKAALLFHPGRKPPPIGEANAGVTLAALADRSEAVSWLQTEHQALIAVITQAGEWGLDTQAWQLAWCLAEYLGFEGHWNDWIRAQRAALDAAVRLGDFTALAYSHRGLGQALMEGGHFAAAAVQLQLAQPFVAQAGNRSGEALILQMLADLYGKQGRCQEALANLICATGIYEEVGNEPGRATALNNVGVQYVKLGRYAEALAPCTEALAVFTGMGNIHGMSAVHDTLGSAYFGNGDYRVSIEHFRQSLALDRGTGRRYIEADTLSRISEVYLASGDQPAAERALEEALGILQELGHPDVPTVEEKLGALKSGPARQPGPA
jgi:DNA-binding SARP family transcriptional activator/tetratricopeptide (TPR) repeat protein